MTKICGACGLPLSECCENPEILRGVAEWQAAWNALTPEEQKARWAEALVDEERFLAGREMDAIMARYRARRPSRNRRFSRKELRRHQAADRALREQQARERAHD